MIGIYAVLLVSGIALGKYDPSCEFLGLSAGWYENTLAAHVFDLCDAVATPIDMTLQQDDDYWNVAYEVSIDLRQKKMKPCVWNGTFEERTTGIMTEWWGSDVPPCNSTNNTCVVMTGVNSSRLECCTRSCTQLAWPSLPEVANWTLREADDPETGGVVLTLPTLPSDDSAPSECPYDPHFGHFLDRHASINVDCDKNAGAKWKFDSMSEPQQCNYYAEVRSSAACPKTTVKCLESHSTYIPNDPSCVFLVTNTSTADDILAYNLCNLGNFSMPYNPFKDVENGTFEIAFPGNKQPLRACTPIPKFEDGPFTYPSAAFYWGDPDEKNNYRQFCEPLAQHALPILQPKDRANLESGGIKLIYQVYPPNDQDMRECEYNTVQRNFRSYHLDLDLDCDINGSYSKVDLQSLTPTKTPCSYTLHAKSKAFCGIPLTTCF